MLNRLEKYRKPLFLLLLIAYFSSTFQQPIYEAIHLISHLTDIAHSNYKHHSHDHNQSDLDHDHPLLITLDNDQNQENVPIPVEQETKKKVELTTQSNEIHLLKSNYKTDAFLYLIASSLFEKEDLSPPPRVV